MERLANLIFYALLIVLLYFTFPFFVPFVLALVIATILEPLILFIMRKTSINRTLVASSVITAIFLFLAFLTFISVKKLIDEAISLTKKIPEWYNDLVNNQFFIGDFYNDLSPSNKEYIRETVTSLVAKVTDFITKYAGNLFDFLMAFPGYFIALIVFIVATYIISIELPNLKGTFLKFFEEGRSRSKIEIVIDKMKLAIIGFLRAQIILSSLTFIICAIGFSILKIELVIFVSILVVVVDLLPIVGTGTVLVPWAVYSFINNEISLGIGLLFLFVFITVFRRIIEPKLLGSSIGLNPLSTLITMYVGLELIGLVGMFLGPAIMIIIQALDEADFLKIKIKI